MIYSFKKLYVSQCDYCQKLRIMQHQQTAELLIHKQCDDVLIKFCFKCTKIINQSGLKMNQTNNSDSMVEIVSIELFENLNSPYVKPFQLKFKKDGKILTWDCIQTHDSVAILIYNISRKVLVFVRQFRPPVFLSTLFNQFNLNINSKIEELQEKSRQLDREVGYTMELCAGIIDKKGLTPEQIAQEEIFEETGYRPPLDSLESITKFRYGVGTAGSLQHLFYCQVDDSMRVNSGGGIDDESIEVLELSIEECKKHIYANDQQNGIGRPAGLRLAISWFLTEKLPKINQPN